MYGVEGERDFTERTLDHLRGYRDNLPVRVGNGTWTQIQLDVLVEVIDAVHVLRDDLGELDERLQDLVVVLADRAAAQWSEPDAAMWKAPRRTAPLRVVEADVLVGARPGHRPGRPARRLRSHRTLDGESGRDPSRRPRTCLERAPPVPYAGAFDSDELDASVLMMAIVGFLPAGEPRMTRHDRGRRAPPRRRRSRPAMGH